MEVQENHQENKVDIKEEIQSINMVRAKVIDLKAGKKKKDLNYVKLKSQKKKIKIMKDARYFNIYI